MPKCSDNGTLFSPEIRNEYYDYYESVNNDRLEAKWSNKQN